MRPQNKLSKGYNSVKDNQKKLSINVKNWKELPWKRNGGWKLIKKGWKTYEVGHLERETLKCWLRRAVIRTPTRTNYWKWGTCGCVCFSCILRKCMKYQLYSTSFLLGWFEVYNMWEGSLVDFGSEETYGGTEGLYLSKWSNQSSESNFWPSPL